MSGLNSWEQRHGLRRYEIGYGNNEGATREIDELDYADEQLAAAQEHTDTVQRLEYVSQEEWEDYHERLAEYDRLALERMNQRQIEKWRRSGMSESDIANAYL